MSGLIDFGGMRADTVAGDIARLLGSLVADDADGWQTGLAAYDRRRPLSPDERRLVTAFDHSGVLDERIGVDRVDLRRPARFRFSRCDRKPARHQRLRGWPG